MTTRAITPVSQLGDIDVDELDDSLWLDLDRPSENERQHLSELLGEKIPGWVP